MRKQGVSDDDIKKSLASSGWRQDEITNLFAQGENSLLPPPPPHTLATGNPKNDQPIAVVQRYTTVGIEYAVMFLALGFAAISLGVLLHELADAWFFGDPTDESASMAGVTALVTLPIFTTLFMRLKRRENAEPAVRSDASRRKGVQLTLLVSFIWGIWTVIYYLYSLVNSLSGGVPDYSYYYETQPLTPALFQVQQLVHALITIAIAGGIFGYYWHDEHRHTS